MRELDAARAELLAQLTPLPTEIVPLSAASGRILAVAPIARTDLPPFDNSAMDGFAVRAADVIAVPTSLRVIGEVAAGGWFEGSLKLGESVRLFTGAPLPAGADAVVRQEETGPGPAGAGQVMVREGAKPWENVRFRGEDVRAGASLLPAGSVVGPAGLGLLAAAGVAELEVYRRPRVGIVATGSELVSVGGTLGRGEIFESNLLMLAELVRRAGAEPMVFPTVPDAPDLTCAVLRQASSTTDVILTAGGASVGEHDLVKSAVATLGGTIEQWRLALKPGKPFFWGRIENRPIFGVPGNPVSAFVTTVLLVQPALRRMQGAAEVLPPTTPGQLEAPLANPDNRRHFVRVITHASGRVRPSGIQASHRLASLAAADGLVDVPGLSELPAGATVRVIRW